MVALIHEDVYISTDCEKYAYLGFVRVSVAIVSHMKFPGTLFDTQGCYKVGYTLVIASYGFAMFSTLFQSCYGCKHFVTTLK